MHIALNALSTKQCTAGMAADIIMKWTFFSLSLILLKKHSRAWSVHTQRRTLIQNAFLFYLIRIVWCVFTCARAGLMAFFFLFFYQFIRSFLAYLLAHIRVCTVSLVGQPNGTRCFRIEKRNRIKWHAVRSKCKWKQIKAKRNFNDTHTHTKPVSGMPTA